MSFVRSHFIYFVRYFVISLYSSLFLEVFIISFVRYGLLSFVSYYLVFCCLVSSLFL